MNRPPESAHVWRQCNTLAVARNFYQEDMNLFKPRVDNRFETNGVTGMNFPLYEYGVASLYKVFGEHNWVHRVLSLLIFSIGVIGLHRVVIALGAPNPQANFSSIALLFFPDLFYFSISALPDILALSCTIWGLYFFIRWNATVVTNRRVPGDLYLSAAAILLMLCGLVKLYFLLTGAFILGLMLPRFREYLAFPTLIRLLVFAVICVVPPLLWYNYSIDLIARSGLADFGLEVRYETDPVKALAILTQNIVSDLPELILNYVNTIFLLAGIYFVFRNRLYKNPLFTAFLSFSIAAVLYHLAELRQMQHHSYYMMPYYPVLAMMAGYGCYRLFLHIPEFIAILVMLSPLMSAVRIISSRWMNDNNKQVPAVLYNERTRSELDNAVNDSVLCVISGDLSNCIYFYFLNKKGFCHASDSQLLGRMPGGEPVIENNIRRGAEVLYLRSSDSNTVRALERYLDGLILQRDDFSVYRLKKYAAIRET